MDAHLRRRRRLRIARAATGLVTGAVLAVVGVRLHWAPWPVASGVGLVVGIGFALVVTRSVERTLKPFNDMVDGHDRDTVRQAAAAVRRGQVPADARVRAVAVDIVRGRLELLQGGRRTFPYRHIALMTGAYVVVAVLWSPWWWLAAAFFAVMLVTTVWQVTSARRWLRRHESV